MPQVGDTFQVDVSFSVATGDIIHNIFTCELQNFTGDDWGDVATDVQAWLGEMYADYLPVMSNQVASTLLTIAVRDKLAGQWNQVYQAAYTALQGGNISEQTANQISPHLNAFPELVRYRGGKYLPPIGESDITDGLFDASVTNALALFAIDYILPYSGVNAVWLNGVISLATETFRRFQGQATFDDRPSAVQSRKAGIGE